MANNENILKEVRPRLVSIVEELVAKGAEKRAVIYMIEKESTQLREVIDSMSGTDDGAGSEEPSNDWPAAGPS
ncbi:hypothetical protein [Rhizobium tumorigenes]|uniref:Uncharacterized protein n=1 Tax=Rhizobium tumorigenes TaxID=2041385 RepID=A0AAF1KS50_9HYPH|nr:hypothetical protein [Rhizobium tumorigenes]WFR97482.1 hypothetical protein PR017_19880 [Rhizobium tumorigenes]